MVVRQQKITNVHEHMKGAQKQKTKIVKNR